MTLGVSEKRLLVIHRHALFRETLATVFRDVHHFRIVRDFPSDDGAKSALRGKRTVTVALLDVDHPRESAIRLVRAAKRLKHHDVRCVVLAPREEHEKAIQCVAEGAIGFALEESSLDELVTAVMRAVDGTPYCPPRMLQTVFRQIASTMQPSRSEIELNLTAREHEVLQLLADHLSNKEVAQRLCVSQFTIKNHVRNILSKLKVDSRSKAVEYAYRRDLITHSLCHQERD